MGKQKIKIIELGNLRKPLNRKWLGKHKSNLFEITEYSQREFLPRPSGNYGTLDVVYSKNEITILLKDEKYDGIIVGIMNYGYDDNFYMHRIGDNSMVVSIYGLRKILADEEICVENFILKNIYEAVAFYNIFGGLTNDGVYGMVHQDTRGCLFDLNGDRQDVIYNTEKAIVCEECKGRLKSSSLPDGFVHLLERGLTQIDKPLIKRVEVFIRRYPLVSFLGAILGATAINTASNFIYDWIRGK